MIQFKYKAFISYAHADEAWAEWLHKQLEGFHPPEDLQITDRLTPVFRDRDELSASRDLGNSIQEALRGSEYLIVVCSPASAASTWVHAEIDHFSQLGRDSHILCLLVDGQPHHPEQECLPEPLKAREPLAVDVRSDRDGRSNSILKLAAAMLRIDFNELRRREKSIAVLPFRDISAEKNWGHLSEGIAEELLNKLSQLHGIRVISGTSSFTFKDSQLVASEIGRRLDASHVVEGSLRSIDNRVRVAIKLIDSRTDSTRWSKTYNRTLDEIFELEDDIASDVATELQQTVLKFSREHAITAEAHHLRLRARHLSKQFTKEALERSNELLLRAITLEGEYVEAWTLLGSNYATQAGEGFIPVNQGIEKSRSMNERALLIDPKSCEALSGMGWLLLRYDNNLPAAAAVLQEALSMGRNNADVLNSTGGLLFRLRRSAEAIIVIEYLTEIDPLNSHAFANLGAYNLFEKRSDEAIRAYRTALELSPGFIGANFAIGRALLQKGKVEASLASMDKEMDDEFRTKGRAMAFYDMGDIKAYEAEIDHLIKEWGSEWPSEVAEVFAYTGNANASFEWIYKDMELSHGEGWAESVVSDVFSKLHNDKRWDDLLISLNLAPTHLAKISFVVPGYLR